MYIRHFGREITIHTVIYGVYVRFWPTLLKLDGSRGSSASQTNTLGIIACYVCIAYVIAYYVCIAYVIACHVCIAYVIACYVCSAYVIACHVCIAYVIACHVCIAYVFFQVCWGWLLVLCE